jgi:hypothetical protein
LWSTKVISSEILIKKWHRHYTTSQPCCRLNPNRKKGNSSPNGLFIWILKKGESPLQLIVQLILMLHKFSYSFKTTRYWYSYNFRWHWYFVVSICLPVLFSSISLLFSLEFYNVILFLLPYPHWSSFRVLQWYTHLYLLQYQHCAIDQVTILFSILHFLFFHIKKFNLEYENIQQLLIIKCKLYENISNHIER